MSQLSARQQQQEQRHCVRSTGAKQFLAAPPLQCATAPLQPPSRAMLHPSSSPPARCCISPRPLQPPTWTTLQPVLMMASASSFGCRYFVSGNEGQSCRGQEAAAGAAWRVLMLPVAQACHGWHTASHSMQHAGREGAAERCQLGMRPSRRHTACTQCACGPAIIGPGRNLPHCMLPTPACLGGNAAMLPASLVNPGSQLARGGIWV